ncbi:hypothetical protein, partial [Marivita sp. S2033]|uniref:hypothetical protein n=1 Tax=Marivita sp. S2033 TaxID=3373187 RepID=UPI003981D821
MKVHSQNGILWKVWAANDRFPQTDAAPVQVQLTAPFRRFCAAIQDMNALKRAFNRELEPSPEELTVCSMSVPSR